MTYGRRPEPLWPWGQGPTGHWPVSGHGVSQRWLTFPDGGRGPGQFQPPGGTYPPYAGYVPPGGGDRDRWQPLRWPYGQPLRFDSGTGPPADLAGRYPPEQFRPAEDWPEPYQPVVDRPGHLWPGAFQPHRTLSPDPWSPQPPQPPQPPRPVPLPSSPLLTPPQRAGQSHRVPRRGRACPARRRALAGLLALTALVIVILVTGCGGAPAPGRSGAPVPAPAGRASQHATKAAATKSRPQPSTAATVAARQVPPSEPATTATATPAPTRSASAARPAG